MNKISTLGKVNKYLLYLAVFFTPLFFSPLSSDVLNLPKRFFLLALVVISAIAWLLKQQLRGELKFKLAQKYYWLAGLILGTFTLSLVFSVWRGLSFWGSPYVVVDSLLSIITFLLLTFLIINSLRGNEYFNLIYLLVAAGTIVSLLALGQLYGSFGIGAPSLVGGFNSAAVFAAALLPLALALFFHTQKYRIGLGISCVILVGTVTLINFQVAWVVVLLGALISLFFSTWNSKQFSLGWVIALMACLSLALFFIVFSYSPPFFPSRPPEASVGLGSEYDILRGTFGEGFKNKLLGTGPAGFTFKYSRYRPSSLNQTIFWGTRFRQGSSVFWDWIITKGILGGLALVLLWGYIGIKGIKEVLDIDSSQWGVRLGLVSSLIALISAQLFYSFNFSLMFLFWASIGIFIGVGVSEPRKIKLAKLPRYSLIAVLVVVVLLGGGLVFVQGIRYKAANNHQQGLTLYQQGEFERAISKVSRAAELSSIPFSSPVDLYYRDLGQIYLARANHVSSDEEEINPGLVQKSVADGVKALNRGIDLAPFNPANWNVRGFYFRKLLGVEQAGKLALQSYNRAAELEPTSPYAYGELGRVHTLMAQSSESEKEEHLQKATQNLEKAIDLKPDYIPAHYLLAVVYDQQDNLDQAITKLEQTEVVAAGDLGVSFQLGLLYWRKGEYSQAEDKFERIVKANPDYSNARYMLALAYHRQDKKEQSQRQLEKISELNPDNQRVERMLESLKQEDSELEDLETPSRPLQETPREIKEE